MVLTTASATGDGLAAAGLLVLVGGYWVAFARLAWQRQGAGRLLRRRAVRAEAVAREAAVDEDAFDPEQIRAEVAQALEFMQAVMRGDEDVPAAQRPDARVLTAWAPTKPGAGHELSFVRPGVELLRVVNREGETEDRVSVRVRFDVYRRLGPGLRVPVFPVDQRWTLGREGVRWLVLTIDGDPLSSAPIEQQSIASASVDQERLWEQSLAELARADAAPAGFALEGLVSADASAYARLLDLAALDGRFAPVLIAASVQHIVEAWEESSTGTSQPLALVASPSAVAALLHPDPSDREAKLVLQDATVERCEPVELELARTPPAIRLIVDVSAVRYLWVDSHGPTGGNICVRSRMSMTWTLELRTNEEPPWQLLTSTRPASRFSHV
jgi:hypothetical protein